MGDIGIPELVLILFVILLLFGPSKIPEIARSLGTSIKEFKKALKEGEEEKSEGSDQNLTKAADRTAKETEKGK